MATEASKTRRIWPEHVVALLRGEGIDIGCGSDPILPHVECFDQAQGDANQISRYVRKKYDFVFSSHCLEHMHDPRKALAEWYSILKPGGHLIVLVPDEDLYELGAFPSLFNADHKSTFTISKTRSWSPCSYNLLDLARGLPGAETVSLELQDHGYDRKMMNHSPGRGARYLGKLYRKFRPAAGSIAFARFMARLGAPIDQTDLPGSDRLAQLQLIVKKTGPASS
jgi:SAM-dependent methyltransferase